MDRLIPLVLIYYFPLYASLSLSLPLTLSLCSLTRLFGPSGEITLHSFVNMCLGEFPMQSLFHPAAQIISNLVCQR